MKIWIAILATALLALNSYGADDPLPSPPSGFKWHEAKNKVGAFLVPDGWFVKEESDQDTEAIFVTREDIDVAGRFIVGLTVNEFANISKRTRGSASKFARSYAETLKKEKVVLKSGVVKGNSFDMNVARVRGDNNGVATIVHHIAIGNDAQDRVYLLIFEAPEREWETESKHAEPMLNAFALGE
jgi:hypothetical protein